MADPNGAPPPEIKVETVIISFYPDKGNIEIKGPMGNRVLMYGMLEMAKEALLRHGINRAPMREGLIAIPTPGGGIIS